MSDPSIGLGRALGTTPSGPYGVGGEDTDLAGLPAGLLPLSTTPATTLAATNNAAPEPVADEAEQLKVTQEEETVTEDDDTTQAAREADTGTDASTREVTRPRLLRQIVRGPIEFDRPKPPSSVRPSGDRPLKKVLNALTGQRPEPAAEASEPGGETGPKPGNAE